MGKKARIFPIEKIYSSDSIILKENREFARIVHQTGDIDASGDEIEIPFREVLKNRLPSEYFVGHGHIVDKNMNVSPQFDVIIVDANSTNTLFTSMNGTQYFPYESVYAIGEIKSTYNKNTSQVANFVESLSVVNNELNRENSIDKRMTRKFSEKRFDDIFCFMFFGNSNNFCKENYITQVKSMFEKNDHVISPNMISFLDEKVIINGIETGKQDDLSISNIVKGSRSEIRGEAHLNIFDLKDNNASGQSLALLIFGLLEHCRNYELNKPNYGKYMEKIIESSYEKKFVLLK